MIRMTTLLLLLCAFSANAFAASGIKGRTAWRNEVCAGVKVRAYRSIAELAKDAMQRQPSSLPPGSPGSARTTPRVPQP